MMIRTRKRTHNIPRPSYGKVGLRVLDARTLTFADMRNRWVWAWLRLRGPVEVPKIGAGFWVVASYDGVKRVLEYTSNAYTLVPVTLWTTPEARSVLTAFEDLKPVGAAAPTREAHKRRAMVECFPGSRGDVARLRPVIREKVEELLDEHLPLSGETDLREIAAQLPIRIMALLVGIPASKVDMLRKCDVAITWGDPTVEEQTEFGRNLAEFWAFVKEFVATYEPTDDDTSMIANLLRWRDDQGKPLETLDIQSIVFNVLVAGSETTRMLILNAIYTALSKRRQGQRYWAWLRRHPENIRAFVEEVLRVYPPITGWLRYAEKDIEVDGVTIPAGSRIIALIGSANVQHRGGHWFRLKRPPRPKLSFGHGPHFCIGALLAPVEAEEVMRSLLGRAPRLRLLKGFKPRYAANVAVGDMPELLVVV
jgi:cytochrome P450